VSERIEAAIRHEGPIGDNPPAEAMLTGWLVVAEWAMPDDPERRWVDTRVPPLQGVAQSAGLASLAARYIGSDG
jgi:hypothetical protein